MSLIRAVLESSTDFEEVILDWRNVLAFDDSERDHTLIQAFAQSIASRGTEVLLVGQERIAAYLVANGWPQGCPMCVTAYDKEPPAAFLLFELGTAVEKAVTDGLVVVICETDRLNRLRFAGAITA